MFHLWPGIPRSCSLTTLLGPVLTSARQSGPWQTPHRTRLTVSNHAGAHRKIFHSPYNFAGFNIKPTRLHFLESIIFSLFLSFANLGTSLVLLAFSFELVKTIKSATDYHSESLREVNPAAGR